MARGTGAHKRPGQNRFKQLPTLPEVPCPVLRKRQLHSADQRIQNGRQNQRETSFLEQVMEELSRSV